MARINRFTSRVQADLACSMLTANGINARVSGDDAGGVHPDIPFGIGGTAVVVPDDELERATELLDELHVDVDDREPPEVLPRQRRGVRTAMLIALAVLSAGVLVSLFEVTFG